MGDNSSPVNCQPSAGWRNAYWLVRHGHSKANEQCLIVSSVENGVKAEYSLTQQGRVQALNAARVLREQIRHRSTPRSTNVKIYCSPFSRTRETAEVIANELGQPTLEVEPLHDLRERFFGGLELQNHGQYADVWEADAQDESTQPPGSGESVAQVAQRLRSLLGRLEREHTGQHIALVSHGDVLSILAAVAHGADLRAHRGWGLPTGGLLCLGAPGG
mmetsp:Transcript_42822/g.101636  ORF Transcript_42822/g.101636 Transcript_42822/m.101636 type:complete len:218 (+) Transcript_42822:380-1033(+)